MNVKCMPMKINAYSLIFTKFKLEVYLGSLHSLHISINLLMYFSLSEFSVQF